MRRETAVGLFVLAMVFMVLGLVVKPLVIPCGVAGFLLLLTAGLMLILAAKPAPPPKRGPRPLSGPELAAQALDLARTELANVARFEREGNLDGIVRNMDSARVNLLNYSLHTFDGPDDAVAFLRAKDVGGLMRKALPLARRSDEERASRGLPTSGGAIGEVQVDVHLAWLIGDYEVGNEIIRRFRDHRFDGSGGWEEFRGVYFHAMDCFASRTPFEPDVSRFDRIIWYFTPYILLMADIASGRPIEASLSQVDEAWRRHNAGYHPGAWHMLDGGGDVPLKWNFRRASILAYARDHYDRDATE